MKKIFAILLLFVVAGAITFWAMFIKSQVVTNENLVAVSFNKNYLKVETRESAKYISDLKYRISTDTVELTVRTTTVLNPFADKLTSKVVKLKSEIRYVKIGSTIKPIGSLNRI